MRMHELRRKEGKTSIKTVVLVLNHSSMVLRSLNSLNMNSITYQHCYWECQSPNKKTRKPYTITKSRQSWTELEHAKFLEALKRFNRDWKKIEAFVGSKTVTQIRSHAQKYFLKVQKKGTSEHVPPPRSKKKSADAYPQKASKTGFRSSPHTAVMSPWLHSSVLPVKVPCTTKASMPDFAQVYSFIGSVFDPNITGHMERLKNMDPVDVKAVVVLMTNLSINLSRPDFESHRKLLSTCSTISEDVEAKNANTIHAINFRQVQRRPRMV